MRASTTAQESVLPRFLVDEMLQRLGRWLRAAGYDVVIANNAEHDYALLRHALDEGRLLLTRDRELAGRRRAEGTVILLEGESLEACARELTDKLQINWQLSPFNRCLQCNTLLSPANASQRESIPEDVESNSPVYFCPVCQQVYWDGSHVRRMRNHLARWQAHDFHLRVDN